MNVAKMVDAYAECAVWSSLDWDNQIGGNPQPMDAEYSTDDLGEDAWDSFRTDCEDFADANSVDLADMDAEQAGHDFWLTRNRHGAGFWDRGLGERGDRLTKAAHVYGEVDLWVGEDGKIHA